jgi:DNA-binding PadR family transcriptional regulator
MAPLTPAVIHVLLALAGGEQHGYAILKDVARQTQDRLHLGPGTIYSTLQRLMEMGWVEETDGPARVVDERRRHYRLTTSGREAIAAEIDRLNDVMRIARAHRIVPKSSRT